MGLGTKNRQKQTAELCKQHLRQIRFRESLSCSVTGLNLQCRLSDIFFVHPAKTLLEQLKADVLSCNKYPWQPGCTSPGKTDTEMIGFLRS